MGSTVLTSALSLFRPDGPPPDALVGRRLCKALEHRGSKIKTCPYCTESLPFFNLIRQRLTPSEQKAIECPSCKSTISVQGGASMWASFGIGSTGGYLLGKVFGGFSVEVVVASVVFGLLIFVISSYFTAPIRRG